MGVQDCRALDLPVIHAPEGDLTVLEGEEHVPFEIARIYYIYGVPGGARRGGHAHRALRQLLIAVAGSFDVLLDDGSEKRTVTLDHPARGLMLTPMIWRELIDFSPGAVCVVLASDHYDEADYFRDYDDFLAAVRESS
ncbi:MAG: sugar 3,4-ketoisomerase [Solirubrobacterales bacterium]